MLIKFKLIILITLFLIVGLAAAQQQPPPYPAAYWINGTVGRGALPAGQPLDGFTVIFYQNNGTPWTAFAAAITDRDGNFRLNAMDDLRMFDPTTRSLAAGNYFIGVGWREVGGVFYGVNQNDTAGVLTAADLANGSKNVGTLNLAAGQGVWSPGPLQIVTTTLPSGTLDIAYTASLIGTGGEPPYTWTWTLVPGSDTLPPGLNLGRASGTIAGIPNRSGTFNFSVRLADGIGTPPVDQPFTVNVAFTEGTGPRVNVRILLRGLYTGGGAGNPQQGAASLVLEAYNAPDISQVSAVNLVGSCVLTPVGGSPVEFSNNGVWETIPLEGDYFIVIRQSIAGAARGTNHLPIILSERVSVRVGALPINLTAGSPAFTPADRPRLPAMMTFDGQNMLWPGDIDGNGYINTNDTAAWFESFRRFNAGSAAAGDSRADVDGNGIINTTDTALWFETFRVINTGNFDGPHGYAPPPPRIP